jgi:hypothetical protein
MKIVKNLLIILLLIAAGAGAFYGWKFYIKAKTPVLDAFYMLPQDAAVVVGFNDYAKFSQQIEDNNAIWQDIRNTKQLAEKKAAVDSILNELSKVEEFNKMMSNSYTRMYVSYHFAGKGRFETVYSISMTTPIDEKLLLDKLRKDFYVREREFEAETIYEISSKKQKKSFFLSQLRGVLFLTAYEPLAEKIVITAKHADPAKQKLKSRMLKMSGKDMSANVYVSYRYLYRLLSDYTATQYRPILMSLGGFSQMADFDVSIEKDRLSLSGFSVETDSFNGFLSTYVPYNPVACKAANILPATTSYLFFQGAEQLPELLKKRAATAQSERDEEMIERYKARYLVDVGDYFYPWMHNELVFALSKTHSADLVEGAFTLIEATDIKEAKQSLARLANAVNEKKNITDTAIVRYRLYDINSINLPALLPTLFGKMFGAMEHCYYTNIDNYIVFANSRKSLESVIDNYLVEQVLQNTDVYAKTMEVMSGESNIFIYTNLHFLRPNIRKFLSEQGAELLEHSGLAFDNFGVFALEYISDGRDMYTSLMLQHGGEQEIDQPIAWKTALDNPVARGPYSIINHRNGKQEVLVFDKSKFMYRIDESGSIVWTVPVLEFPMSKVFLVDFYKNGKYQYMFNSKNYLYLYDLNGNRVEHYPVKLPAEAVAPMTVVDYDKNKRYRILIPLADGKVYNFKIDGTETPGWKYPQMEYPVHNAVQFFKLGSKDFLVISDTSGNAIFANRRGERRMSAQLAFTNNPRTPFFKKSGGGRHKIITTDMRGRIVSIDADGNVNKKLLREFTPGHTFAYFDFDGDRHKDYIFLDKNSLYIFNHEGKLMHQHSFSQNLSPVIHNVSMPTKESVRIILHDADNQHLILVTKTGEIIEKEDFTLSPVFIKEEATKSEILRLIGVSGRIVSSFLIK